MRKALLCLVMVFIPATTAAQRPAERQPVHLNTILDLASPQGGSDETRRPPKTKSGQTGGSAAADRRQFWGYAFVAPGIGALPSTQRLLHWGGGLEWRFHGSVGIAAEVGFLHASHPAPILSVNGTYHLRDARAGQKSLIPFLTAGYTLGPEEHDAWLNLGAGANYWLRGRLGLRFEVRYHPYRQGSTCPFSDPGCRNWLLNFRGGLIF